MKTTTLSGRTTSPGAELRRLRVVPISHPQGCRTYVLADPESRQALVVDVHLDAVAEVAALVREQSLELRYVVDTHTHADHPSGAAALAEMAGGTRVAHKKAEHAGVTHHARDGEELRLGEVPVTVRHAPGHTPDHLVLLADGALFSGDTLLIGAVARTDFLGGDAGELFDTLQRVLADLPDETVLFPGHDYEGRTQSTLGEERAHNPWLLLNDRAEFVRQLAANPPPRPANMDDLLRLNREGKPLPSSMPAAEAARLVAAGGGNSVVDVRTGAEYDAEHVVGSRLVPMDQLERRLDEVRATPAPRLLLCKAGTRAAMARSTLARHGLGGLVVVEGGIDAFVRAGGAVERGRAVWSLERQVRVGAGSLVLLGVLLGTLVHAAFLGLAAFVGAGLVFAGVTDWCGMGLLLAKAPWNRSRSAGASPAAGGCAASAPASGCAATPPSGGGCSAAPPKG
jgi:glyoxylase-like metal-dependent hydrolase (beta-lactamase superfamily II)